MALISPGASLVTLVYDRHRLRSDVSSIFLSAMWSVPSTDFKNTAFPLVTSMKSRTDSTERLWTSLHRSKVMVDSNFAADASKGQIYSSMLSYASSRSCRENLLLPAQCQDVYNVQERYMGWKTYCLLWCQQSLNETRNGAEICSKKRHLLLFIAY